MIQKYLNKLGDTVTVKKPNGLYYIEIFKGTDLSPLNSNSIGFLCK